MAERSNAWSRRLARENDRLMEMVPGRSQLAFAVFLNRVFKD